MAERSQAMVRFGGFVVGMVVLLAGAIAVGKAVGPIEYIETASEGHGPIAHSNDGYSHHEGGPSPAQGLSPILDGYTLVPGTVKVAAGKAAPYGYTVLGRDKKPIRGFTPQQGWPMHVVLVRQDFGVFQHLKPKQTGVGTFAVDLPALEAGRYRVLVDVAPVGYGRPLTLGSDLDVTGTYLPKQAPAPTKNMRTGPYSVDVEGDLLPDSLNKLTVRFSRDGKQLNDMDPYMAGYAHVVVLRVGDLAQLRVNPIDAQKETGDGEITTQVEIPKTGAYVMFVEFSHRGDTHVTGMTFLAEEAQ
jgi:hypothetical protein